MHHRRAKGSTPSRPSGINSTSPKEVVSKVKKRSSSKNHLPSFGKIHLRIAAFFQASGAPVTAAKLLLFVLVTCIIAWVAWITWVAQTFPGSVSPLATIELESNAVGLRGLSDITSRVHLPEPFFAREAKTGMMFFISTTGEKYHAPSCFPCDNQYTICPTAQTPAKYIIPVLEERDLAFPWSALSGNINNKFVCPMHPLGLQDAVLDWKKDSIADSDIIGTPGFVGFVKDLIYKPGTIYFVQDQKKHHVESCMPCGRQYDLCPSNDALSSSDRNSFVKLSLLYKENPHFAEIQEGPKFSCRQYPQIFEGYSAWHRKPLNVQVDPNEQRRLNIVMTGVGKDLTGGPLSIMRFASAMLARQPGYGIRWINVDGQGIKGPELISHLKKYDSLETFRKELVFVHDALNPRNSVIRVNPDDLFMSTIYYTSLICHETTKHPKLNNKNFLYFIQDFEPIFFPQGADYLEALESYRYPHFAIYSTWFLHNWFQEREYGQYQFLDKNIADKYAFASEPAIKPWGDFDTSVFDDSTRTRKLIVYARSHADRNAYELTMHILSEVVCENVIVPGIWQIIGVGAIEDYTEYLGGSCGKKVPMQIFANIPEPEYRKIVRSGDVGLSLMVSPHPSLPPFDFVSAGLVTVTNSFQTKRPEHFERISKLFVVSEPFPIELVQALRTAITKSEDIEFRKRESSKMNWETEWDGERCYGKTIYDKLESWFETKEPLWEM